MTIYRCDKGHELSFPENATYTTFRVQWNEDGKDYNYCPHCFGEWAVQQWPFREVKAEAS
jgi:hypothetical protein